MKKKKTTYANPASILKAMITNGSIRQYEDGGDLNKNGKSGLNTAINAVSTVSNLIPGIGTAVSIGTQLIPVIADLFKKEPPSPLNKNTPQLKMGGEVSGYKSYTNAPKHENGGLNVNEKGLPGGKIVGNVEGGETKYTYSNLRPGETYVFSDKLGTANLVKSTIKKYKNADKDPLAKNAMEVEINNVQSVNEKLKQLVEPQAQQQQIPQYGLGDVIMPVVNAVNDLTKLKNTTGATGPMDYKSNQNLGNPQVPYYFPTVELTADKIGVTPKSELPITQSLNKDGKVSQPLGENKKPLEFDKLMRGTITGLNALQLLDRTDKEKPVLPDFSKSDARMNAMNANLDAARQEAQGGFNQAGNLNRSASSSFNQYRNRQLQSIENLNDTLGNISLNEQQQRNAILQGQGQYESSKATDIANRLYQNQVNNTQNKAATENMKRVVLGDLMHEADRMSIIKNNKALATATTKEFTEMMKYMYDDFNLNEADVNLLQRYVRGEVTEKDLNAATLEFVKTNIGKK